MVGNHRYSVGRDTPAAAATADNVSFAEPRSAIARRAASKISSAVVELCVTSPKHYILGQMCKAPVLGLLSAGRLVDGIRCRARRRRVRRAVRSLVRNPARGGRRRRRSRASRRSGIRASRRCSARVGKPTDTATRRASSCACHRRRRARSPTTTCPCSTRRSSRPRRPAFRSRRHCITEIDPTWLGAPFTVMRARRRPHHRRGAALRRLARRARSGRPSGVARAVPGDARRDPRRRYRTGRRRLVCRYVTTRRNSRTGTAISSGRQWQSRSPNSSTRSRGAAAMRSRTSRCAPGSALGRCAPGEHRVR